MTTNISVPTLSQFSAELRARNIAKPSMYYVELIAPKIFLDNSNNLDASDIKLVSMWCHAAQTPQSNIDTADDYREAGTRRKFAYDRDYQNLVLSFYIDQEYKIKRFFDQWRHAITPQRLNFGFPDDYTTPSLKVYIINQEGIPTYCYDYSNVFPKTVQSIELSYAPGGAVSSFTVEFVFEEVYCSSITNGEIDFTTKPNNNILNSNAGAGIKNEEVKAYFSEETMYTDLGIPLITPNR
jgi:hypothetical protein